MTVLVTVDGEKTPSPVLEVGYDLATAYDDPVVVLHVMAQSMFESRSDEIPNYYADDATNDARATAREVIEATLDGDGDSSSGDGPDVTPKGRVGGIEDSILAEADSLDARYLVIGGRKRSPVGKALLGSVTQDVLLESERPVLTVRTDLEE